MNTSINIRVPHPYDFPGCVNGHGWISLQPFVRNENGFTRIETLSTGKVVRIDVSSRCGRGSTTIKAVVHEVLSNKQQMEIEQKLRLMLRLDEDLSEFYGLCEDRQDGHDGYRAAVGKGRLLRSPTLFEDAFKVILTTNTTWNQTRNMVARSVEALGKPLRGSKTWRSFPTPNAVIEAGVRVFEKQIRLGYRSSAVVALAERASELEDLSHSDLPTEELRKQLLRFKGIGPYAAASLLMLLGRYDYLAIDSEMRSFTSRKYFAGRVPSDAEMLALYEEWGRWKYLGHWLDVDS
ncbi:MAG: DNA-3-methyladenine glycosylase family protein [Pyrinomonadaceae bacterium]